MALELLPARRRQFVTLTALACASSGEGLHAVEFTLEPPSLTFMPSRPQDSYRLFH